jgi:hypothetical protein
MLVSRPTHLHIAMSCQRRMGLDDTEMDIGQHKKLKTSEIWRGV